MKTVLLFSGDSRESPYLLEAATRIESAQVFLIVATAGSAKDRKNRFEEHLQKLGRLPVSEDAVRTLWQRAFPGRPYDLHDLARAHNCRLLCLDRPGDPAFSTLLEQERPDLVLCLLPDRLVSPQTLPQSVGQALAVTIAGRDPAEPVSGLRVTLLKTSPRETCWQELTTRDVSRHPGDNEKTLQRRAESVAAQLFLDALQPVDSLPDTAVTAEEPLLRDLPAVQARKRPAKDLAKTLFYLSLYRAGLCRPFRRGQKSRAKILLFHRINDQSCDPLTTSPRDFARFLILFQNYGRVRSTAWLVDRLEKRRPIAPETILLHFDDCYRDFHREAAPLLEAAGLPATFFISTGFLDSDQRFEHDGIYPGTFANLSRQEVRDLARRGFEIGAHTVHHVDLGTCPADRLEEEILDCREELSRITGQKIPFFSFPFGSLQNIRPEAREIVRSAGFNALFSACGGTVSKESDLFDLPRCGVSSAHRPLDLLYELGDLSFSALTAAARKGLRR